MCRVLTWVLLAGLILEHEGPECFLGCLDNSWDRVFD